MMDRGYSDRGGLNFAVGGGELLDGAETAAAELARYSVCAGRIGVDDSDQPHRRAFAGKLVVDASVVAAECAHTNYGNVYEVVSAQWSVTVGRLPGLVDLITKDDSDQSRVDMNKCIVVLNLDQGVRAFFSNAIWPAW